MAGSKQNKRKPLHQQGSQDWWERWGKFVIPSVAVIIAAIISYFGTIVPLKMEIESTKIAETSKAILTSSSITETASFNSTQTQMADFLVLTSTFQTILKTPETPTFTPSRTITPTPTLTITPSPTPTFIGGGSGYIVFSAKDEDGDLEIYSLDLSRKNRVTVKLTNNTVKDSDPVWSPDGQKIAFVSTRDGSADIFFMNFDGSDVQNITRSSAPEYSPAWTPDDSKIVFSSHTGNMQIYKYNISSENKILLTADINYDAEPTVSLDGSNLVVFESNRYDNDYSALYVMGLDGGNPKRLSPNRNKKYDISPSFSQDGTKIVFVSKDYFNQTDIYVMNADGSNIQQITNTREFSEMSPSWSPDGEYIIFSRDNSAIYVIKADGSDLELIVEISEANYPSWRP